jgi:16S rRNA (cytosine967-C5)-methyltransferase
MDGVADCVTPGGVLVYAVCSHEPAEGADVVAQFLTRHPDFSHGDNLPAFFRGARSALVTGGHVATWPHRHETDGFFVGRLRRH